MTARRAIAGVLSDFGLGEEDRVAWEQSGLPDKAFDD